MTELTCQLLIVSVLSVALALLSASAITGLVFAALGIPVTVVLAALQGLGE